MLTAESSPAPENFFQKRFPSESRDVLKNNQRKSKRRVPDGIKKHPRAPEPPGQPLQLPIIAIRGAYDNRAYGRKGEPACSGHNLRFR
jgi:hypothetical protein